MSLLLCREYLQYVRTKREWKPASVNKMVYLFKSFSYYLVTYEGLSKYSAVSQVPKLHVPDSLPDYFSKAETRKLISARVPNCPEHVHETYDLAFELQSRTAMRFGEVCSLKAKHVVKRDRLWFVEVRSGKTGDRTIKLPKVMQNRLLTYIKERGVRPHETIFKGKFGEPLSVEGANLHLKHRAKLVGIDPVRAHTHLFRHGFLTIAAEAGWSNQQMKNISGHRKSSTLDKYVHLSGIHTKIIDDHPLNSK